MASIEERLRSRLTTAVKQVAEEITTQAFTGTLVKRLIVRGSFRNVISDDGTVEGFQLKVKNKLGVGTIIGCTPVKIDGETFPLDVITVHRGNQIIRAAELSETMPVVIGFGDEMLIRMADDQGLESGKHSLELGLKIVGVGLANVSFEDTLAGEGRPRVRKPEAAEGDFPGVMRRAIEMAVAHIGRDALAGYSATVRGIVLELTDIQQKFSVAIGADGESTYSQGGLSGEKILTIATTRTAFHNMAHNKLNPGIAYANGDIRLEGIPVLKLRGMDAVITAIFQGYRAASEGTDFEQAVASGPSGMLEEMLGFMFTTLDELLKNLDKLLGRFGVKYFYEKSLNRIEWLWDILDREMRQRLSFGRGGDKDKRASATSSPGAARPSQATQEPRSPDGSLQGRLRARISTAINSAVGEISRSAVSGYLVKRLIQENSFRNYGPADAIEGFEVKLKNRLGAATLIGFAELKVDGNIYAMDSIEITQGRRSFKASEISQRRPLQVAFNEELLIRIQQPGGIAPGKHRVALGVDIVGLGGMDVDYEEKLSA